MFGQKYWAEDLLKKKKKKKKKRKRKRSIWDDFLNESISCGYSSGPSCSKLTMSLVNDSLKFTSSDTQIC